jgi:4-amino-4-deoxy-L-arabinose transferase-like glycosyltransferase
MKLRAAVPLAIAVLLWAALVAVGLWVRPPLPVDETRYLAVAWEMWRTGDYLVPHLNGIAYHHKPPLLFWLMTAGWHMFGVSAAWGRLIAPLFALGSLLLVARLAYLLFPKYPELVGVAPLALIGTAFFALFASFTFFDMPLTFFVLLALLAVWQAAQGQPRRGWSVYAVAIGLGILSKGPVAILNVAPVALLAPWWAPRHPVSWRHWYAEFVFATVLGGVIALAWAIPAAFAGGSDFAYMLFIGQTTERVVEALWHERPWWWYVPVCFALIYPWLWWPAFWRSLLVRGVEREPGVRFCLAMVVPVFVAFSAISGKQPHYLLPLISVFMLLLSRHVLAAAQAGRFADRRLLRWPPVVLVAAAGVALTALSLAPSWIAAKIPEATDLPAFGATGMICGAVVLLLALLIAIDWPRGPILRVATFSIATAAIIVAVQLAEAPDLRARFDVSDTAHVLAQAEADNRPIANVADYHGQYNFAGRLTKPIDAIHQDDALAWANAHPDGVLVVYRQDDPATYTVPPLFSHRYRGRFVVIWPASAVIEHGRDLVTDRSGD